MGLGPPVLQGQGPPGAQVAPQGQGPPVLQGQVLRSFLGALSISPLVGVRTVSIVHHPLS